jgi:tRNA(Ile)-lysidine synthase
MRNKIRHHVITVFNEINPSFLKTAVETIERLRETELVFNWAIDQLRNESIEIRNELIYIDFMLLPEKGKATILYEFIHPFGFNNDQCRQILYDDHAQSGTGFYTDSHRLVIDRNYYIINKIKPTEVDSLYVTTETDQIVLDDKTFDFKVLDQPPFVISNEKSIAELDFELLDFPLQLRKW